MPAPMQLLPEGRSVRLVALKNPHGDWRAEGGLNLCFCCRLLSGDRRWTLNVAHMAAWLPNWFWTILLVPIKSLLVCCSICRYTGPILHMFWALVWCVLHCAFKKILHQVGHPPGAWSCTWTGDWGHDSSYWQRYPEVARQLEPWQPVVSDASHIIFTCFWVEISRLSWCNEDVFRVYFRSR